MEIRIERNVRLDRGVQLRFSHGPINKVFDDGPMTFYDAGAFAVELLDEVNKTTGASTKLTQVLRVGQDVIEASAKEGDFAALKMQHDILDKKFELSVPVGVDVTTAKVDGKDETVLSGRGVMLFAYSAWMDDKMPKAREAIVRYCQYVAMHGYKGGAKKALAELDALAKDAGSEWIKKTYARHVSNDAQLIGYVMTTN